MALLLQSVRGGAPHPSATPEGFCQAAKPSVRTAVKLAIPRLILALVGHPRLGAKASQRKPDKLRRSLVLHLCSKLYRIDSRGVPVGSTRAGWITNGISTGAAGRFGPVGLPGARRR